MTTTGYKALSRIPDVRALAANELTNCTPGDTLTAVSDFYQSDFKHVYYLDGTHAWRCARTCTRTT